MNFKLLAALAVLATAAAAFVQYKSLEDQSAILGGHGWGPIAANALTMMSSYASDNDAYFWYTDDDVTAFRNWKPKLKRDWASFDDTPYWFLNQYSYFAGTFPVLSDFAAKPKFLVPSAVTGAYSTPIGASQPGWTRTTTSTAALSSYLSLSVNLNTWGWIRLATTYYYRVNGGYSATFSCWASNEHAIVDWSGLDTNLEGLMDLYQHSLCQGFGKISSTPTSLGNAMYTGVAKSYVPNPWGSDIPFTGGTSGQRYQFDYAKSSYITSMSHWLRTGTSGLYSNSNRYRGWSGMGVWSTFHGESATYNRFTAILPVVQEGIAAADVAAYHDISNSAFDKRVRIFDAGAGSENIDFRTRAWYWLSDSFTLSINAHGGNRGTPFDTGFSNNSFTSREREMGANWEENLQGELMERDGYGFPCQKLKTLALADGDNMKITEFIAADGLTSSDTSVSFFSPPSSAIKYYTWGWANGLAMNPYNGLGWEAVNHVCEDDVMQRIDLFEYFGNQSHASPYTSPPGWTMDRSTRAQWSDIDGTSWLDKSAYPGIANLGTFTTEWFWESFSDSRWASRNLFDRFRNFIALTQRDNLVATPAVVDKVAGWFTNYAPTNAMEWWSAYMNTCAGPYTVGTDSTKSMDYCWGAPMTLGTKGTPFAIDSRPTIWQSASLDLWNGMSASYYLKEAFYPGAWFEFAGDGKTQVVAAQPDVEFWTNITGSGYTWTESSFNHQPAAWLTMHVYAAASDADVCDMCVCRATASGPGEAVSCAFETVVGEEYYVLISDGFGLHEVVINQGYQFPADHISVSRAAVQCAVPDAGYSIDAGSYLYSCGPDSVTLTDVQFCSGAQVVNAWDGSAEIMTLSPDDAPELAGLCWVPTYSSMSNYTYNSSSTSSDHGGNTPAPDTEPDTGAAAATSAGIVVALVAALMAMVLAA